MQSLIESTLLTMSSLEIAELCDKRHDHVMRDIRKMLEELGLTIGGAPNSGGTSDGQETNHPNFGGVYRDKKGEERLCFKLPQKLTYNLMMGYSATLRDRVINRWLELEAQMAPTPAVALNQFEDAKNTFSAFHHVALLCELKGNQALLSANAATERNTSINFLEQMQLSLPSPVQALTYVPTELGKMLESKKSPMEVNSLLADLGLQKSYRDNNNSKKWKMTEKGLNHGEYIDTAKTCGGSMVKQIKWYDTVVPLMEKELTYEE